MAGSLHGQARRGDVAAGDVVAATEGSTEEDGMKRDVPDDIKHLVMTEEELAAAVKGAHESNLAAEKSQARTKSRFIKFPKEWQYQLGRADADKCAYRVALYLLEEVWRSQSKRVKLANAGLKELNVGRRGKRHALDQLGKLGLISSERQPRKSPVVTVKFTD
jgi:hypothetical protein